MMTFLKAIPVSIYLFLGVVALCVFFEFHGRNVVQERWDFAKQQQAINDQQQIDQRYAEIADLKAAQAITNQTIQKVHDEEINTISSALARSERLRISTKFCLDPARQANTKSPASSDGADTGGRLLSEEVDRAVKQLILETEKATATGRAAQAFIRENGLAE